MALLSNLLPRLRLLRIALTRRFIWSEVCDMALNHGFVMRDIRANVHPLAFANSLSGEKAKALDYASLGSVSSFSRSNAYEWNSEPSVGSFLGDLILASRAKTVVELGCFVGWSSAHMALALQALSPEAHLWCVDFNEEFLEAARHNLTTRGLGNQVSFLRGMSLEEAILSKLPDKIDVLFLDTSHEYEDTVKEIDTYLKRLSPGGFLILHDSISQPGVRRSTSECHPRHQIMTFATESGNGLTVIRAPKP